MFRISGNKLKNNPLVSAETVRHSSTCIILYLSHRTDTRLGRLKLLYWGSINLYCVFELDTSGIKSCKRINYIIYYKRLITIRLKKIIVYERMSCKGTCKCYLLSIFDIWWNHWWHYDDTFNQRDGKGINISPATDILDINQWLSVFYHIFILRLQFQELFHSNVGEWGFYLMLSEIKQAVN